jgi:hypothetical protein
VRRIEICRLVLAAAMAVALALFLRPAPARADTCTWDGSTGDWSDAGKWDCGHAPGGSDTARVYGGTVSVNADTSVGGAEFYGGRMGGSATLTVLGMMSHRAAGWSTSPRWPR